MPKRTASNPARGEPGSAPPPAARNSFWQDEYDNFIRIHPGEWIPYQGAGNTAVTTLKRKFGLEAVSRTDSEGVTTVWVRYSPEKTEEIKKAVDEKGAGMAEKRRASKNGDKGQASPTKPQNLQKRPAKTA